MSVAKAIKHGKSKSTGGRGSVNNERRLEAFSQRKDKAGADWGGCDSERMQGVVVAITALGGAITFGLARDKGAHSMTLMLGGERQTLWFNGDADLDAELDSALQLLVSME